MPHVVVVPFGVPEDGEGLGIGLAALVHGFVRMSGEHVGLAQLLSKDGAKTVEAFVPPSAWKEIAQNGPETPETQKLDVVVTGSFEPPSIGRGGMELLAFDPKTGVVRAREEVAFGTDDAGTAVAETLGSFCEKLEADASAVATLRDLPWASLESVLYAERCFAPNPLKNGARDAFAALGHLERAISDAPEARFPAARLATCAMEAAFSATSHLLREAALRSVVRALSDAPAQVELLEAASAMELRFASPIAAEARLLAALEIAPDRGSLWALLCESRRTRNDHEGALAAVRSGMARGIEDPLLYTEEAVLHVDAGNNGAAMARFKDVLRRWPFFPSAFKNLAQVALRENDAVTAQSLVDAVLAARTQLHPDVLRQAIELALRTESPGIARASRVLALARSVTQMVPQDAWARLVLSRALVDTGDKAGALAALSSVEAIAPDTVMAAEAQRGRFQLQGEHAALAVEAILRAAYGANESELESLAARARRLTLEHDAWICAFALGIVERRRERWDAARDAFEDAVKRAPGCAPAHVELCGVYVSLKNGEQAIAHAEKARALEGDSARTLAVLATALITAGRKEEAEAAIDRALAQDPNNPHHRALSEKIRSTPPPAPAPSRASSFLSWLKKK
jgi:tetratricopeptide (TPR) repeat protein